MHNAADFPDDPEGRPLSDAENAAIHHAWKEFWANLEAYERLHGKKLSESQRAAHVFAFSSLILRRYGRSQPTSTWEARRKDWEERGPRGANA